MTPTRIRRLLPQDFRYRRSEHAVDRFGSRIGVALLITSRLVASSHKHFCSSLALPVYEFGHFAAFLGLATFLMTSASLGASGYLLRIRALGMGGGLTRAALELANIGVILLVLGLALTWWIGFQTSISASSSFAADCVVRLGTTWRDTSGAHAGRWA